MRSGHAAFSLAVAAAVGGVVGARVYWFFEHVGDASLTDSFSGAGFTWYGGVLGAAAPALALGYGIGRIACQLAGDGTYGVASDLPWAMSYPHGEVPTTERVHPTPVYETLASLVIFALLWRLRSRMPPLRLFGLYLVLAGGERLLVEFIRRNEEVVFGLTQPQLFALAMLAAGAMLLALSGRLRAREPGTAPADGVAQRAASTARRKASTPNEPSIRAGIRPRSSKVKSQTRSRGETLGAGDTGPCSRRCRRTPPDGRRSSGPRTRSRAAARCPSPGRRRATGTVAASRRATPRDPCRAPR